MKKTVCALLSLLLLCACALAEPDGFSAGEGAAALGDSLFFAVDEGATRALVRVDGAGKAMLAERAEEIGSLVVHEGELYYLRKLSGRWELMKRGEASEETSIYAFEAGCDVRALGAYGGDLFALVDERLHILYPARKLCLRLAGARMREYVIADGYAYYISPADIISYELPAPTGAARGEAGCLYRLNLSTGNTALVMKAGAEDLKCASGRLYFHNLADGYLSSRGEETWVEGRLYSFGLESETLARELDDYDWDYFPTEDGLIVHRADGVRFAGDIVLCSGARAELWYANGRLLVYDPDGPSFEVYPVK